MNEPKEALFLKGRTKEFALQVIKLYAALPRKTEALVLGKQLLRSGTSAVPTIEKPSEPNPMLNLSVNSREACRNWKRPSTGLNCLRRAGLLWEIESQSYKKKRMN